MRNDLQQQQWSPEWYLQTLKGEIYQPRIIYLIKLSFRNGWKKNLANKQKLKVFISYQEIPNKITLKGMTLGERKIISDIKYRVR